MFSARQAFDWLDAARLFGSGAEIFSAVCIDTRKLTPGCLYVPIKGERFDGHEFVDAALAGGANGVLFDALDNVVAPAIQVADTRHALGQLARGWRRHFNLPVVAVTGSNGKTTVKEMIASIMSAAVGESRRLATRGNLNNEIGVPLTLFELSASHRMAVIELGMNHPGEIDWLAQIAQPTVALVNNAQREHQEFLDGVEATAIENGSVFARLSPDGIAVFPGDDDYTAIWCELSRGKQQLTFGWASEAGRFDVWAQPGSGAGQGVTMHLGSQAVPVTLNIDGAHNVRNALAAAACARAVGIDAELIARGLTQFMPYNGRMQRATSASGATLINDTYNANPDSVRAAIEVLASLPEPRILVLGDMAEVGAQGPQFHREIGEFARNQGVQALFATGPLCKETVAAFGRGAVHFDEVQQLSNAVTRMARANSSILVKGSRSMRMERVVQALQQPREPQQEQNNSNTTAAEARDAA